MQRLFSATIAFTWDKREQGEWHDAGFRVAKETHLWWNPAQPEQTVSWRSEVHLSPSFFEAVCRKPVPVDLRVLKALRGPMALDLYCWLTYRNSYLAKPTRVPWPALQAQFGADYSDRKDFERRLRRCPLSRGKVASFATLAGAGSPAGPLVDSTTRGQP